jgi:hypothetical protein
MSKLKLTVNEEKTRICKVREGEFDFLGYTFGRMYSARTGQAAARGIPDIRLCIAAFDPKRTLQYRRTSYCTVMRFTRRRSWIL